MEINLLPHIPTSQRYRYQIALIVGVVVVLFSSFIGFQIWYKNNQIEENQAKLAQLQSERQALNKKVQEQDQLSKLANTYQNEYSRLKAADINWVPIIDEISKKLPSDGKILQMNWSDDGIIKMAGDFASLESVGQYLQLLYSLEYVDQVQFVNGQSAGEASGSRLQVFINVKINPESLYFINNLIPGGEKK